MAASLLLACDLNEQKLPAFILLREDSGVDGSFLISSILGQRLKIQNNGTVLICLHHTAQHYSNVGMRLGFNLNMARDKGTLAIIEPLQDIGENLFTSKYLTSIKCDILEILLTKIVQEIDRQLNTKQNVTILIDNIGNLIDLGCDENLILRFCHKLIDLSNEKISIILKINTCQLYESICKNLEDIADAQIHVVKLPSGNFKEVDGKIIYYKRLENGYDRSVKQLLYKVNDRNIKIFQPGEVGV